VINTDIALDISANMFMQLEEILITKTLLKVLTRLSQNGHQRTIKLREEEVILCLFQI